MRIQKLLRIFERVDPFWLIFLDKDLCGQISADGILCDSNFSATYLESVSSSGSLYEMGGKVRKTMAKPDHILTDVCLSRLSSSDSHYASRRGDATDHAFSGTNRLRGELIRVRT